MKIRTMIADDHDIFRSGLQALLERAPDIDVVAEAGNGFDAIRVIAETEIDVLILDLGMPGLPGSRVAETVVQEKPRVAIVILTMYEDSYYLRDLFRIGVRAFVLKKSPAANLLQAIRSAHRGDSYVDPLLAGRVISDRAASCIKRDQRGIDVLTPREQEVCRLLAYGHTNCEIAGQLSISARTVECHRASIMAKLDLRSRAEMVRFALESSLIKLA